MSTTAVPAETTAGSRQTGSPTRGETSGTLPGFALAVTSALAFGVAGSFMKPVLESGWSPGAAVLARILVAAAVLLVPTLLALRGRWRTLWAARRHVLGFGAIAVAATQLAYFAAIERIPVGTALLIEYLAPVLLVLLVWCRSRQVPQRVVLAGTGLSLLGLTLVIGPAVGGAMDPVGIGFALLAAVGLASYFLFGAVQHGVPPVAMTGVALVVGAVVLAAAGLVGVVPLHAQFGQVSLLTSSVPWFVPVGIVAVIGTAVAYVTGIAATARIGSRVASFVGLLEVVFATMFAWLLLGESLGSAQLLGGALIVAGIALVRSERMVGVVDDGPVATLGG